MQMGNGTTESRYRDLYDAWTRDTNLLLSYLLWHRYLSALLASLEGCIFWRDVLMG